MSLERVTKALESLGLARVDAEVYVYLAQNGSQKLTDLVLVLNYSKEEINVGLENLIKKTTEYYNNIRIARGYFRGKGKRIKAEDSGLMEKLRYYKDDERINNIPFYKKLGAAFGLEVITDGVVFVAQALGGYRTRYQYDTRLGLRDRFYNILGHHCRLV